MFCVPHTNNDAITPPSTIVCPTNPGKREPASGKNTILVISRSVLAEISPKSTSPTPKTNASSTKCPSTFDRTLLVTVYTPSCNGGVLTTSELSPSKYVVSLLSTRSPLLSKTFSSLKSISTPSE